jgi:alkylation response protein AidB-like acyl-CoA dehydrogenase
VIAASSTELEGRFGDPFDDANPLGFAAILRADERGEMFTDGERALRDHRLNADFVPVEFGGRLARLDDLVAVLRSVYRRDPSLGLGYGMSSFIASVNVWLAGDDAQRRSAAELLLGGSRIAAAYHELAHGNDMAGTECAVVSVGGRQVLRGRKEIVTNLRRAEALVLFARTDERPGSRSHSQVLLDKRALDPSLVRDLPRFPSSGMRGVQLHGIDFDDCPLPPGSMLGRSGGGLETALRSFQITRSVIPAVLCGTAETGLRIVLRHLREWQLYGGAAIDLPQVRSALAGAFADLLIVDCFGAVALRAVHLLPGEASLFASVYKHFGSALLLHTMNTLTELLGARFYLRSGPTGIFQKLLRDLRVVGFGHAARGACESNVLPQLPVLARRSWAHPEAAPDELFHVDGELPPLDFDRLRLTSGGRDHLSGSLYEAAGDLTGEAARLAGEFAAEHAALTVECRDLPATELSVLAGPRSSELVNRIGHLLAASACLGVWRHNPGRGGLPDDAVWPLALLTRLRDRDAALPEDLAAPLFTELLGRLDAGRAFDLTGRTLPDLSN